MDVDDDVAVVWQSNKKDGVVEVAVVVVETYNVVVLGCSQTKSAYWAERECKAVLPPIATAFWAIKPELTTL